ncbi:Vesicle transport protein S20 [Dimargaris xerosporica]|nr:Vesicle transport protein S20 [Dimargaris xerosporica]
MADALRQHIETLGKNESELTQLIGALSAGVDSLQDQQDLSAIIREQHRNIHKVIQQLKTQAEELDRDADRQACLALLSDHEKHCTRTQQAIRQALLKSKQFLDRRARNERQELLKGASLETVRANELRRRRAAEGSVVLGAANDVTESLRRTTQLMSSEIDHSLTNAAQLEESSTLVRSALGEHQTLSSLLRTSQLVISKLEQGDLTDRLLLLFGLIVFITVVLYILKKRLWFPGSGVLRWVAHILFSSPASVTTSATLKTTATQLLATLAE